MFKKCAGEAQSTNATSVLQLPMQYTVCHRLHFRSEKRQTTKMLLPAHTYTSPMTIAYFQHEKICIWPALHYVQKAHTYRLKYIFAQINELVQSANDPLDDGASYQTHFVPIPHSYTANWRHKISKQHFQKSMRKHTHTCMQRHTHTKQYKRISKLVWTSQNDVSEANNAVMRTCT